MRPLPEDNSTDNGADVIGWYNEETGQWDKAEPDMPAFTHMDGCPLRRPELYNLDEHPLECLCADLRADS